MVVCKIGDICTWCKGHQVPREDTSVDKKIPYLHYGDLYKLYDFRLRLKEKFPGIIKIDENVKISTEQYLHDGDVVFTLTSETVEDLGHCTLIMDSDGLPFVSGMETTVVHIKDKSAVMPAYLNYYFHSKRFIATLQRFVTGMKVYRVHPGDLMEITIELPSVENQIKIVNILDSISNQIDCKRRINDNLGGACLAL